MESSTIEASVNGDQPEHIGEPVDRVKLGEHDYEVYEQRIGYLQNKLRRTFAQLVTREVDSPDDLLGALVVNPSYKLLKVFFGSRLMPEWEFEGYPTKEAWEAGDYKPEYDKSPGPTQARKAIETAARVNSLDLFKSVADFFPRETRDAIVNELVLAGISLLKKSGGSLLNASALTTGGLSTTSGTTDSTTDDDGQTADSTSD